MEKRKFLVIVDPSHERHLALERILDIIQQRREWVREFHLLVGFESDDKVIPIRLMKSFVVMIGSETCCSRWMNLEWITPRNFSGPVAGGILS